MKRFFGKRQGLEFECNSWTQDVEGKNKNCYYKDCALQTVTIKTVIAGLSIS